MLTIDEGVIYHTRGDTGYIQLAFDYDWQDGDTVTLSVKKDYESEDYLFQKTVVGGQIITIYPQDTAELEYGNYIYDVQVNTALGEVFTVVGPNKYKLTKEVTI